MYVMHHHTQTCTCGHTESWSHLYLATIPGDPTRLKACDQAVPPEAAIQLIHLPGKPVPVCAACLPADAATRGAAARAAFEAARRRKRDEAATPPAAKPQRIPTLEELA